MEKLQMNFENVDFIDDDKISVIFLSIVLRVDSINKLFPGGLKEFMKSELIHGECNGRLFTFSEMQSVPHHIQNVYEQLLEPNGFIHKKDFVLGLDEICCDENRGKPLEC